MELSPDQNARQLRLRSCIETVLAVNKALGTSEFIPDLGQRLKDLKRVLLGLDASAVAEADVSKVESVTNHLLEELKPVLKVRGLERIFTAGAH